MRGTMMAETISFGTPRRLAIAGDEIRQRQAPRAGAGQQLHLRIQGQQRRHAVGRRRGIAEIAGDRARF